MYKIDYDAYKWGEMGRGRKYQMSEKRVIQVVNCNPYAVTSRIGGLEVELKPMSVVVVAMPNRTASLCLYDSQRKFINAKVFGSGTRSAVVHNGTNITTFVTRIPLLPLPNKNMID